MKDCLLYFFVLYFNYKDKDSWSSEISWNILCCISLCCILTIKIKIHDLLRYLGTFYVVFLGVESCCIGWSLFPIFHRCIYMFAFCCVCQRYEKPWDIVTSHSLVHPTLIAHASLPSGKAHLQSTPCVILFMFLFQIGDLTYLNVLFFEWNVWMSFAVSKNVHPFFTDGITVCSTGPELESCLVSRFFQGFHWL